MKIESMHWIESSDAHLVAESLSGNRDAFGQIVERYQTLIASLAYCATGNVGHSEDQVLFYREHQSIETVAAGLGLSEDAVKQRLSRGRKFLQEQFMAFVAGALDQTRPGKTFALGVPAAFASGKTFSPLPKRF